MHSDDDPSKMDPIDDLASALDVEGPEGIDGINDVILKAVDELTNKDAEIERLRGELAGWMSKFNSSEVLANTLRTMSEQLERERDEAREERDAILEAKNAIAQVLGTEEGQSITVTAENLVARVAALEEIIRRGWYLTDTGPDEYAVGDVHGPDPKVRKVGTGKTPEEAIDAAVREVQK